ncbi:paralemmin 1a isoform X2 [Gouania willdenowi]|uniref:paralemmin 1a isoform X2 n=1 Tax=Gouania willdenowi TaxID=441366 RepID=UPI00105496D0|nr:paralemmin-1-like isoform X2 [Gouania willdenowi]
MEVSQQDRLQFLEDQRKLQLEFDDHKLEQENDRRTQQLLKSQAERERWLLERPSSTGPGFSHIRTMEPPEPGENQRRTINRLDEDVMRPGAGLSTVTEVKGHRAAAEEMKRALYSVQITVERDWLTGQTRVLSTNTTLPFDPEHQAVKVYEDELKVVHEVNGVDGFHQLSSSEVEDLIHKADEVSMMTSAEAPQPEVPLTEIPVSEVSGLKVPGLQEDQVSAESPVSMVFMGYHSVEDEDETIKVLGLQGTARAELVLIEEETTPPEQEVPPTVPAPRQEVPPTVPASSAPPDIKASKTENRAVIKKENKPRRCCSIM